MRKKQGFGPVITRLSLLNIRPNKNQEVEICMYKKR
uniref:Uncharacterized protein n=1 Tax=Podoviridae sp. ctuch15 TaxID=2827752 RepID=A0A8S5T1R7_9CAUD|nr:MAG TPA: hypothetical protein [Podoviridae sp. ctuch15]